VEGFAHTVGRQEVLAAALEAEELAIEGTEVRISEDGARARRLHAPLAAFSRRLFQLLVRSALDRRTAHLGTPDGSTIAPAAATRPHVPRLVVLVHNPIQAALAPHFGHRTAWTAAIWLLEFGSALQDRAGGSLAHGGAVQAGAVRTPVRHKLRLLRINAFVEEAFAWKRKNEYIYLVYIFIQ